MDLLQSVRHILYADHFVSTQKAKEERRNQQGIALIAMGASAIMSLLNLRQGSFAMLGATTISAIFLYIGYLVSKYKHRDAFLKWIFYILLVVIFTSYTVMGGNEGFSALWLIVGAYAVMIGIDLKAGFLISLYYLIMLVLLFNGPLSFLLQFDYNKTFRLRFPFLYAINFAFATFIAIRIRMYQYELLLKQQELEHLSTVDLSTGLMNRNNFIQKTLCFPCSDLKTLLAVFIDVNGLHEINNRDGHDAGDKMLCYVADLCKEYFPNDSIFRMGGDEFLIICRNADRDHTVLTAKRLFDAVEQAGYSISYGIEMQKSDFDLNKLVKDADAKMIEFKRNYYKSKNIKNR